MYSEEAAKHAGVSVATVLKYWKKEDLPVGRQRHVFDLELLENVFDLTEKNPEKLTLEEIAERLSYDGRISISHLQERLDFFVELGIYKKIDGKNKTKYRPGMPSLLGLMNSEEDSIAEGITES